MRRKPRVRDVGERCPSGTRSHLVGGDTGDGDTARAQPTAGAVTASQKQPQHEPHICPAPQTRAVSSPRHPEPSSPGCVTATPGTSHQPPGWKAITPPRRHPLCPGSPQPRGTRHPAAPILLLRNCDKYTTAPTTPLPCRAEPSANTPDLYLYKITPQKEQLNPQGRVGRGGASAATPFPHGRGCTAKRARGPGGAGDPPFPPRIFLFIQFCHAREFGRSRTIRLPLPAARGRAAPGEGGKRPGPVLLPPGSRGGLRPPPPLGSCPPSRRVPQRLSEVVAGLV